MECISRLSQGPIRPQNLQQIGRGNVRELWKFVKRIRDVFLSVRRATMNRLFSRT